MPTSYMQKVIQRLARLCQKTPRGELWKAAGAFVETLEARVNPVNTAVKSLLRELDSEIRKLTDEHADILQQPIPEPLLKNLLYYVARARIWTAPRSIHCAKLTNWLTHYLRMMMSMRLAPGYPVPGEMLSIQSSAHSMKNLPG